jgi:hypothetical protein
MFLSVSRLQQDFLCMYIGSSTSSSSVFIYLKSNLIEVMLLVTLEPSLTFTSGSVFAADELVISNKKYVEV